MAKGGKFLENVRASGVCGDGGGGRNLSEICLSEEKFACEKFAYVSNEICAWAKWKNMFHYLARPYVRRTR